MFCWKEDLERTSERLYAKNNRVRSSLLSRRYNANSGVTFVFLVLILVLLLTGTDGRAANTIVVPHGSVTLVSEYPFIEPNTNFWLGVRFRLDRGWHTYWINPGDSGEAPQFVWQLPAGLNAGAIKWPVPNRLPSPGGIMDFGYEGDTLFLVRVRNASRLVVGSTIEISVLVKLVVCRDLCIPGRAQLSLALPVQAPHAEEPNASLAILNMFAASREQLPIPIPQAWSIRASETKDDVLLNVKTSRALSQSHVFFFPLDEQVIENSAPQSVERMPRGFKMRLQKSSQFLKPISHLRGVIVLGSRGYTLDARLSGESEGH
jgi:DsbC/DsbD-like thiol-disulfide interchange protein